MIIRFLDPRVRVWGFVGLRGTRNVSFFGGEFRGFSGLKV